MRIRHIVICGLPRSPYFTTFSHKQHDLRNKIYWKENVCYEFHYNFYVKYISFKGELSEVWLKKYIGCHVNYTLFLSILIKL